MRVSVCMCVCVCERERERGRKDRERANPARSARRSASILLEAATARFAHSSIFSTLDEHVDFRGDRLRVGWLNEGVPREQKTLKTQSHISPRVLVYEEKRVDETR